MRKLALLGLLIYALVLAGCGTTTSSPITTATANGTWSAQLTGGAGDASAISFVTQFIVNGDGSLEVVSLTFLTTQTSGSCFPKGATAGGTLNLTTNPYNVVVGNLTFNVNSTPPGTKLVMTGVENGTSVTGVTGGNSITGNWTMTGSCSGYGNFTMTESGGGTAATSQNHSLR